MEIITNWIPRNMVAKYELPAEVQKDFDYNEDDDYSNRYVQYKGQWIDAYDTQRIEMEKEGSRMGWAMRVHPGSPVGLFDAIISDSYFSGTLLKFVGDDQVIVARYYS